MHYTRVCVRIYQPKTFELLIDTKQYKERVRRKKYCLKCTAHKTGSKEAVALTRLSAFNGTLR